MWKARPGKMENVCLDFGNCRSKKDRNINRFFADAVFCIIMERMNGWQILEYRRIP